MLTITLVITTTIIIIVFGDCAVKRGETVNPCNFRTLDRFKCNWLATATDNWNGLPADLILQGEACGWRTIFKNVQRCICT